jgi:hypothetical protein
MAFEWNFRELMRPRLANAYANRTWETIPTQPTEPMPTQMDPNGQAWLASQQARNAQNMQGYIPNNAKQGYGYDYEDRSQSIAGEVGQDYYGTAAGDRGATAATIVPEKIKSLESQIAQLEQRIAANKQKLQNWGGVENQIAALEARKINRQDPTSIWRWKVERDDARRIANSQNNNSTAKANALIEANNELDNMIINDSLDTPTKNAMLSKLSGIKSTLEKLGLPTERVKEKIDLLKGNGEQTSREQAKTDWNGLKGKPGLKSSEIQAALDDKNMNWDPDERKEAENLRDKLKKHEADAQDIEDMKADYKRRTGKDFDKEKPEVQKFEIKRWKRKKSKK